MPLPVPNPLVWWNAEYGVLNAAGNPCVDGEAVASWQTSGSDQTATPYGSASPLPSPIYKTNQRFGRPVVRFPLHAGLARGAFVDHRSTWFIAARQTGQQNGRLMQGPTGNPNILVGWWNGFQDCCYLNGWIAQPGVHGTVYSTTDWQCYTAQVYHAGGPYDYDTISGAFWNRGVFINATLLPGMNGPGIQGWALGASPYGLGEDSDCEVGEFLFYNYALPNADRQAVEAYLMARWMTPPADAPFAFLPQGGSPPPFPTSFLPLTR